MKRLLSASFLLLLVTACSARKSEGPAAQSPTSPAGDAAPATGGAGGYPQQQPGAYGAQPSAPPPAPAASSRPEEAPKPGAMPATPSGRAAAINKDSNDIEAAQRELDVAGSSCQNACRALGSMDRAAGHLCLLTREDNTHDRCDDAKRRLYNARDKVRGSCGTCPDNQPATDRNAPVPSMR
jgi:hypothetical protein